MSIFFYCPWHDKDNWIKSIKKIFKNEKILTTRDDPDYSKIQYAIVWDLPDSINKKLKNLKLFFSMGAGVDHILNLPSYKNTPIIRLKDLLMCERMANHVLSQILHYQLNLKKYSLAQNKNQWLDFNEPLSNSKITIGILGLGFLGSYVGNLLKNLGYNIEGFKASRPKKKYKFRVYYQNKHLKKFISNLDILISILPDTKKTFNFIDNKFLKKMKKNSLLINVGRGSSINEKHLINHLKKNKYFYASLDVFKKEPLPKNNPFWNLSNITITPHVASLTAIDSAVNYMYKNYKKYKKNKKIKSDVNLRKGY